MDTQHQATIEKAATSEYIIRGGHKPKYSRTFGVIYLFCWAWLDTIVILFVDRVARRPLCHACKIIASMRIADLLGSRGWKSEFLPATPSAFNTTAVHSTLMNIAIPVTWRKLMRICSMKSKKMEFRKLHHKQRIPNDSFHIPDSGNTAWMLEGNNFMPGCWDCTPIFWIFWSQVHIHTTERMLVLPVLIHKGKMHLFLFSVQCGSKHTGIGLVG